MRQSKLYSLLSQEEKEKKASNFLEQLKSLDFGKTIEEVKKEYLIKIRHLEKDFKKSYQNELLTRLPIELKSTYKAPNDSSGDIEKPSYLKLTGDYSDKQLYNSFSRLPQQSQQQQDLPLIPIQENIEEKQIFTNFLANNKNVLDTHGNSKYYYPLETEFQLVDQSCKPFSDISNSQQYYLKERLPGLLKSEDSAVQQFQQIDQYQILHLETEKNIYPLSIVNRGEINAIPESEIIQQQQTNLKQKIESLGGFEDTISVMKSSLQQHELRTRNAKKFAIEQVAEQQYDQFQHITIIKDLQKEHEFKINPFEYHPLYEYHLLPKSVKSFDQYNQLVDSKQQSLYQTAKNSQNFVGNSSNNF